MPAKLRPLRFLLNGPRAKPRLAVAATVLAATAAWSFTRPKIYEATASVRYSSRSPSDPLTEQDFATLQQVASSELILLRVADRSPFSDRFSNSTDYQAHRQRMVEELRSKRRVHVETATGTLSIFIREHDADRAAQLADRFLYEMPGGSDSGNFSLSAERFPAAARSPATPIFPNHPLNLSLGLLAGLALGTLVSVIAAHRESVARSS